MRGHTLLWTIAEEIKAFLNETGGIASRLEADRFYIFCEHQEDYHPLLDRIENAAHALREGISIRIRMGVCRWKGMIRY